MLKTTLTAAALTLAATATLADDVRTAPVKSHPSQGDVKTVEGAAARMATHDDGIFVNIDTNSLTPGNVHTLWLVVINNPAACEGDTCTSKDVLKRSEIVDSDVGYAGGVIVDENGDARFAYHQTEGALNGGWFGAGLKASDAAEVHLVVNDHGPVIEGRVDQMLATYRDGCTDESIPAPMPDTARAQGEAGPNQCRLMQFAVFKPEVPAS